MISYMKYISITSHCATQYRSERLSGSGLNGCQCSYIFNICRNPGITQDQLAQQIHVNRSNVTRQLASLEENGFVVRKQSESDKRAIEVYPTDKATDILPTVLDIFHEWRDYLIEDFTDEEKACLLSLIERVARKAEHYADGMLKHD